MDRAPPNIFSRRQAAAKWARSRARQQQPDAAGYLVETIAGDVIERLDFMRLEPQNSLVIGDSSGGLPDWLHSKGSAGHVGVLGEFEEEQPGPREMFDLIVHLLGLGHVNDLPGALVHARNALKTGGLFVAAFPGAGSLAILRAIMLEADGERPAARMHPLVDNQAATGLLQRAGFARQVVDSFPIRVRYPSLTRMVSDLRDQGLTRALTSTVPTLTRASLSRAQEAFDALRDDQGKVTETFEILVLTGWRD